MYGKKSFHFVLTRVYQQYIYSCDHGTEFDILYSGNRAAKCCDEMIYFFIWLCQMSKRLTKKQSHLLEWKQKFRSQIQNAQTFSNVFKNHVIPLKNSPFLIQKAIEQSPDLEDATAVVQSVGMPFFVAENDDEGNTWVRVVYIEGKQLEQTYIVDDPISLEPIPLDRAVLIMYQGKFDLRDAQQLIREEGNSFRRAFDYTEDDKHQIQTYARKSLKVVAKQNATKQIIEKAKTAMTSVLKHMTQDYSIVFINVSDDFLLKDSEAIGAFDLGRDAPFLSEGIPIFAPVKDKNNTWVSVVNIEGKVLEKPYVITDYNSGDRIPLNRAVLVISNYKNNSNRTEQLFDLHDALSLHRWFSTGVDTNVTKKPFKFTTGDIQNISRRVDTPLKQQVERDVATQLVINERQLAIARLARVAAQIPTSSKNSYTLNGHVYDIDALYDSISRDNGYKDPMTGEDCRDDFKNLVMARYKRSCETFEFNGDNGNPYFSNVNKYYNKSGDYIVIDTRNMIIKLFFDNIQVQTDINPIILSTSRDLKKERSTSIYVCNINNKLMVDHGLFRRCFGSICRSVGLQRGGKPSEYHTDRNGVKRRIYTKKINGKQISYIKRRNVDGTYRHQKLKNT